MWIEGSLLPGSDHTAMRAEVWAAAIGITAAIKSGKTIQLLVGR